MEYPKEIKLTSQIEEIITFCPRLVTDPDDSTMCKRYCPLAKVCEKYWGEEG